MRFIEQLKSIKKRPLLAVLIDPEKTDHLSQLLEYLAIGNADLILIGGSSKIAIPSHQIVKRCRQALEIPLLIFPGSVNQVNDEADATMILSMIASSRAEYITGKLLEHSLEILANSSDYFPVAYILFDGKSRSAVERITAEVPLPYSNTDLIKRIAASAELLNFPVIYLEAGSGAAISVPPEIIRMVAEVFNQLIFVGGGISSEAQIQSLAEAGADVIVIGNILEKHPERLPELYRATQLVNIPIL